MPDGRDRSPTTTPPSSTPPAPPGKPKGALGTHRNINSNIMAGGFSAARAFLRRGEAPPAPDPERAAALDAALGAVLPRHRLLRDAGADRRRGGKIVMMRRWDAGARLAS
jgi:long-chain acyl-CoA synthetase